ncbi:sigma-70 family RNA polymerase sigma factor [Streptomyces sp. N35]|uniref:sigma-70 family RNA polymerase sigma factor n=1 Tax=Streptomyces sp. N35 TaxID=2795730 RepID=UPI0018F4083D|nr:sigma-70 family RNA polymerase sigma factor [Streptomyces sp. N35]
MTHGSVGVDAAAYARVYEEQQTQLVAYARSLTGNPWLAEDVVAEAHFRVWRRLSAGHEIDNVAAYLMRTVRNLATTVGGTLARETPVEPAEADTGESEQVSVTFSPSTVDPSTRVSQVDLLRRVLGQLPERWVKALWLAEAEDQSLDAIGRRIGVGRGATAVLLHRAREGMRQAFLRAHPGTPRDPACEIHWERIPALVRDAAAPRHSKQLRTHMDGCEDCRARYLLLARANSHLAALVGPALLVLFLGGGAKFLAPLVTGAAAGASGSGAGTGTGPTGSHLVAPRSARTSSGTDHAVSHSVSHAASHVVTGGLKLPVAVLGAVGVGVTGAAIGVALLAGAGAGEQPFPAPRTATHQPAAVQTNPPAVPASPLMKVTGVGSVPLRTPAERHDAAPPQDGPSQTSQESLAPAAEPGLPEPPEDPAADGTPPQAGTVTNPAPAAQPDQPSAADTPTDPGGAAPSEPAAPEPDPVRPSPEPVTPQPVNPVPAEPEPSTPVPSNPVQPPVDPAPGEPVAPAPVDPAPSEPVDPQPSAPLDPGPIDPPPAEPVDPAPVDPPPPTEPVDPAPVDPPPTTEPVDPAPVCHDILRGDITVTICHTAGG